MRYILIKEYPGSPKLGTIVDYDPQQGCKLYQGLKNRWLYDLDKSPGWWEPYNPVTITTTEDFINELIEYIEGLEEDAGARNSYFVDILENLKNKVIPRDSSVNCKHVRREGESCNLNNNCTYPNCPTDDEKPVETTKGQPEDGIWYNGRCLPLSYEELADLLAHFRDSGDETRCELTRQKCDKAFGSIIPITAY